MKIMKFTIKEDFHRGTRYLFSFSYHKITLFEKNYDIKLITLISMCHLKPLVSMGRFIKNRNVDAQIVHCIETVQILCITTFNFIEKCCRQFV